MHYYNYDADCEDPSTYPKARFVSEHGFQSFPSARVYAPVSRLRSRQSPPYGRRLAAAWPPFCRRFAAAWPPATWPSRTTVIRPSRGRQAQVTAEEDRSRDSSLLFYRQRHEFGNEQALTMMSRHFRVPPANASVADGRSQGELFASYMWLTQLQQARCHEAAVCAHGASCTAASLPCNRLLQARCYEAAFGAWRRGRSEAAGTMGILYWQLNDVWQGPSWSSIECDASSAHTFPRRMTSARPPRDRRRRATAVSPGTTARAS